MTPAPPFAAVLEGLPGVEGWGADSLQGGEGQDWRIQAAGRVGRLEHLGPPGRRLRLHCTTDSPVPRARPLFPSSAAHPQSSLRSHRRFGSFRERSPFSVRRSGGERVEAPPPLLHRRSPPPLVPGQGAPSRSRPPAAGTRVAAYKRGGARASPPLPAAERTARSRGHEGSLVPQQPPAPRTHGFH